MDLLHCFLRIVSSDNSKMISGFCEDAKVMDHGRKPGSGGREKAFGKAETSRF